MTRSVYTLTITDDLGGTVVKRDLSKDEMRQALDRFFMCPQDPVFVVTKREVEEPVNIKFIRIPPKAVLPGDLADHVSGELDPRKVVRVDGIYVYLDILGQTCGPFPKDNYTFTRMIGGQA